MRSFSYSLGAGQDLHPAKDGSLDRLVLLPERAPRILAKDELLSLLRYKLEGKTVVKLSETCHMGCSFCGVNARTLGSRHINYPFAERLFSELKSLGVSGVYPYFDNEPLEYFDRKNKKDLADILILLHELGLKTTLSTHGWPKGSRRAAAAAQKVAALPFELDLTVSVHPFHDDIIFAPSRAAFEAAMNKRLAYYDEVISALSPKRPQIRLFSFSHDDRMEGREISDAATFGKALQERADKEWKDQIGRVLQTPVIWSGRAWRLLNKENRPSASSRKAQIVGESPILVISPAGALSYVFPEQVDSHFAPIGKLFPGGAASGWDDFIERYKSLILQESLRRRRGVLGNFEEENVSAVDPDTQQRLGISPPQGMLERFMLRREETNVGIPARTAAYLYDVLRLGISSDFPERMLAASDAIERARLFPDMASVPVPVRLLGTLFSGDSESVGESMGQLHRIWDFEPSYSTAHRNSESYSDPIHFEIERSLFQVDPEVPESRAG